MEDLQGVSQQLMASQAAMRRVSRTVGAEREAKRALVAVVEVTVSAISGEDVEALARLTLREDARGVLALVRAIEARPVALEGIYVDLLQPAARKLGEWWIADTCTFAEVTIGMLRLHEVLRELGAEFRGALECTGSGGQLLLTLAPGEQHTFGLRVAADFFVRAGWQVSVPAETVSAPETVRGNWFDVVGLSAAADGRLAALADEIVLIRAASCNRRIGVMVGGPMFVAHPEYGPRVGADAVVTDAREAPRVARTLLDSSRIRVE